MPPVILGAALLYGGAISLGTFLLTTVSYGLSKYQESRARRRARRDFNAQLQDRTVMTATVDRARSRVYGRVRNADGILFKATYGPKKEQYCLVIALAGHQVDGLEQVYFGDVPVTLGAGGLVETSPWNGQEYDTATASIPAGSSSVTLPEAPRGGSVQMVAETPDGDVPVGAGVVGAVVSNATHTGFVRRLVYQLTANRHKARVTFWDGSPEQDLSASLAVEFPGLISPGDHRFAGVACLRVDMVYSQDAYPNGVPQISAVFRGARVLDPRLNRAPNPDYLGAAVGGALGAGLAMAVTGGSGVAMSVVGTGAEDGQAYADVRILGTAVGSTALAEISFATTGSRPAAAAGQLWIAGLHARHVAGTAPSVPNLVITERDEAGAVLQSTATGVFIAGPTGLSRVRRTISRTLTQAGTTRVGCHLLYPVSPGQSIDVTVRLGLATLSQTVDAIRWTENPGLIARDWSLYANGGGCSPDDLHGDTFTTAANASDVTHSFESFNQSGATVTTVRPMFTAGIVCDTSANPLDTLSEICEAMAGAYAWTGGRLRVKAGAYSAPVATITADWLSDKGSISMVKDAPVTQLVNVITPTIADAAKKYIAAPLPRIAPAVYIEADGEEHPREDGYLAVTDADHAAHVAGVALRDSRAARTYRLPCNLLALPCDVFDTLALDIPEIGTTGEAFEVQGTELDFEKGLVWLNLKATAASIFDPDAEFRREDALINNAQPNPFMVPALALLTPESGTAHLLRQADGTIISRLCVKWVAVEDEAVINGGAIEIRCGRPGTDPALWQTYSAPGGDTQLYIDAVQDAAAYAVIGRCRNKLVAGAWTVPRVHVIVGKTERPALPSGLTLSVVPGALRGTRTPSTELDYARTIYRYGISFESGLTVPGTSDSGGFVWPSPPVGPVTIWYADVDTSGNIGPAASASITITAAALFPPSNTLSIKLNVNDFAGTVNYNEAYIHGYSNGASADVPGTVLINGVQTPAPNQWVLTNRGPGQFYLMFDTAGLFDFGGLGLRHYAMVRRSGGVWQYDDNSAAWQTFTPSSTMVVIGSVSPASADGNTPPGLTSGSIWATAWSPDAIAAVADSANWSGVGGRPSMYRVAARGYNAVGYPIEAGLYDADTGALLVGPANMFRAIKINRSTKAATNVGGWNTLASTANADAMATELNAIGNDHYVVILTIDEPQGNRLYPPLLAAMLRHGASRHVYGSPQFRYRSAYILVAIGACGEGNGAECYAGDVDGDPNAWCDVGFQIHNGVLQVSGANSGARSLYDFGYVQTDNLDPVAASDGLTSMNPSSESSLGVGAGSGATFGVYNPVLLNYINSVGRQVSVEVTLSTSVELQVYNNSGSGSMGVCSFTAVLQVEHRDGSDTLIATYSEVNPARIFAPSVDGAIGATYKASFQRVAIPAGHKLKATLVAVATINDNVIGYLRTRDSVLNLKIAKA